MFIFMTISEMGMAKLKISNDWWTAPAEGEDGKLILVTGRRNMDNVIASGLFNYRVEITWSYEPDDKGMPDAATSSLMEKVRDALDATFDPDPVAINTGIYTGDGERNWIFYSRSLPIFQRKFNEALSTFEVLPLSIHVEEDPHWKEYLEMKETEIADDDD
jgi:hypothetical protein